MIKVVFACKSNSCRSQMAEGWAKDWVRKEKERLEYVLKNRDDMEDELVILENKLLFLTNIIVMSVALDQSSVYKTNHSDINNTDEKDKGSSCVGCDEGEEKLQNQQQSVPRKLIKAKAIQAMAKDGVDISTHFPKTFNDLIDDYSESSKYDDIDQDRCDLAAGSFFDKLVILCSCGDDVKKHLICRSKSVEEWDVDPPTAAANAGEGDKAYRRISLEIRNKVDTLMTNLIS